MPSCIDPRCSFNTLTRSAVVSEKDQTAMMVILEAKSRKSKKFLPWRA